VGIKMMQHDNFKGIKILPPDNSLMNRTFPHGNNTWPYKDASNTRKSVPILLSFLAQLPLLSPL
jgi:hypothetical protein